MKNGWCKKIICFLVLAIMAISTMGTGVFATEGAEGGEGGDQQVDVNKIISVTPVRGHQRIMVKWEVSDEADADGFIVDRYSYNTGKWTKEYCVVDMDEGQKSETDGQLSFQIEDKDVGDGMIDSAKVAYRGGVFKYRITPYKDTLVTKYALTVNYVDADDSSVILANGYSANLEEGEAYSVPSPSVEGYELADENLATVAGDMPGNDYAVTVKYKKVTDPQASVDGTAEVNAVSKGQEATLSSKQEMVQKQLTECAIETQDTTCVRTSHVYVKLKVNKKLTSHQTSNNKTITLKKGTTVRTCGFYSGKYVFIYDNHVYWLTRISTKNASTSYNKNDVYTKEEAEYFVNMRGTDSGKYLIWVNTYCQRLYIFTGSKGNWKLIDGMPWQVSTGKASSPTIRTIDPKGIPTASIHRGYYSINKKLKKRHNIPYWNCVSGYNAIHGKRGSWSINSVPKSGGCMRNTNAHAQWIYNNCATGKTNVIIF